MLGGVCPESECFHKWAFADTVSPSRISLHDWPLSVFVRVEIHSRTQLLQHESATSPFNTARPRLEIRFCAFAPLSSPSRLGNISSVGYGVRVDDSNARGALVVMADVPAARLE